MSQGVDSRARVHALVERGDLGAALADARSNPHPWYRCQSLAAVASAMKDDSRAALVLREALSAAREQDEPNRIVSVASWPVGVYVRRGISGAAPVVAELLQTISAEPNPLRRADALYLLFGAVLPDRQLQENVLAPLLEACSQAKGWKGRRILQFTAMAIAGEDRARARHIVEMIPESRESRRAKRMLQE